MRSIASRASGPALAILTLVAAACGSGGGASPSAPTTPAPTIAGVTVSGAASLTTAGQTARMTATARLSDGRTQDVTASATWASDNAAIASVSASGLVTANRSGDATIVADYRGTRGTLRVHVALPRRADPAVSGTLTVTTSPEPLFLFRGRLSITYQERSGAAGMNVNYLNTTWFNHAGAAMGQETNYSPSVFASIWGSNHIRAGETKGVTETVDYNGGFISSVQVRVVTSIQDDFGHTTQFGKTFSGGLAIAPSAIPWASGHLDPGAVRLVPRP